MFSKIPKTSISNLALKTLPAVKEDVLLRDLRPQLRAWEKFDWPKEKEQAMYLEWAIHCSRKQNLSDAENYYERSIDLRKSDARALHLLSKCQRQMGKSAMAFESSKKAIVYETRNPKIDREYCSSLYQLNEFEIAKAKAFNISGKYVGSEGEHFKHMGETYGENIKDCFGQPFSEFILKRQNIFSDMLSEHQKNSCAPRPLWKMLKEQEKCDVVSLLEKEAKNLHPREVARRQLASKVFRQAYLPHSWRDARYQLELEKDDAYLLSVFKESTPVLRNLLKTKNEAVYKFIKMLHARCPLYQRFSYKLKNRKLSDLMKEKHLNRVQYQTRRTMFNILDTIKDLRRKGEIEKLTQFVEKAMGEYIIVKTKRVAPWKREFLHEVYNTLALTFTDECVIPPDLVDSTNINALEELFGIQPAKEVLTPIGFVFGNKATRVDLSVSNQAHVRKRKFLEHMEKRLFFAKYSIERAYIYHEIARVHYKTGNYNECEFVAYKVVKESFQTRENLIWAFLCMLLIIKANIATSRREKCADAIEIARNFASNLNSLRLVNFVDQARLFNSYKLLRVKNTDQSDLKKSKSRSIEFNDRDSIKLSET